MKQQDNRWQSIGRVLLLVAIKLGCPSFLPAQVVTTELTSFLSQTGPNTVATFDDVATGTLNPTSSGVTIECGRVANSFNGLQHSAWFGTAGSSPNFCGTTTDISVSFPVPVHAFGVVVSDFGRNANTVRFAWTIYAASGLPIDSGIINHDSFITRSGSLAGSGFLGVISPVPFTSVRIRELTSAPEEVLLTVWIDDVRYATSTSTQSLPNVTDNKSTNHVFPQFADGYFPDGSGYRSTLMVSSDFESRVNCTVTLSGLTVPGLGTTLTFQVSRGFALYKSPGTQPIRAGYATLNCDAPVAAQVLFSFFSPSGSVVNEATVFSSPPAPIAQLIADQSGGSQLALAIANTAASASDFLLVATSYSTGDEIGRKTLHIDGKSQTAIFLNSLFPVPTNFLGRLLITRVGSAAGPVYAIGLRYVGSSFTTIPITTITSWYIQQ